jgi:hypothetical protein
MGEIFVTARLIDEDLSPRISITLPGTITTVYVNAATKKNY